MFSYVQGNSVILHLLNIVLHLLNIDDTFIVFAIIILMTHFISL